LTLPLRNSERVLTKTIPKESNSFKGLKAVIIDDDEAMRALLQEIFGQMDIASEAFQSYESFRTGSDFDFVLTDIQMPKTDGFTILKKLKNGEINSYKNQPIIAMTGSREHSRDFYLNKGFTEMLPKPFSKHELVTVLERIFPNRMNFSGENNTDEIFKSNSTTNEKFDLSLLKSFLNTPEALEEVLEVFNAQTEKDLQQIKNSIAEKDINTITEIAHRMLTMFRQIKAMEAIPTLEKMEFYDLENIEIVEMKMDYEKLVLNIRDLQKALENK
jgi:CheY-like chemotaxis protein